MKKQFLIIFTFGIIFLCFHIGLNQILAKGNMMITKLLKVNAFVFGLTFSFFAMFNFLNKKKNKSPFIYLSLNFAKGLACLIFLFPVIKNYKSSELHYILHFFMIYFAYLFVEIYVLLKLKD
tara:strand:+ start:9105 stop:9470 length:366 start_codon:yes stop_codon:yes gene_type:complete